MRILELIGLSLRPFHSDPSKLTENSSEISAQPKTLQLQSPIFSDGGNIPKDFSIDGTRIFPTIAWGAVPAACKSLLLIIEDPDAPKPTPFVHGIFYNIPATVNSIPESAVLKGGISEELLSQGIRMGNNTMSKAAYMPPAPPPGHGPHHYHFQLIALDTMLDFPGVPTLADVKKEIENHTLAYGEITGIYES